MLGPSAGAAAVTLILFIFFSGALTINRIAHKEDFERKHRAWIEANFPAPKVEGSSCIGSGNRLR